MKIRAWCVVGLVVVACGCGPAAFPASAAAGGSGTSTVSVPVSGPCTYADALARDGETQAANAAYLEVLAADPTSSCANAGVKATTPHSSASFWTQAGDDAKNAGFAIGAIVLAFALLVVIALVWLQIQTRIPGLRDLPPAKKIRRPVFTVGTLSDDATAKGLGCAVAGLVRGRVTWRTDRFGLNLISGQAGVATAFSGLGDVSSEAKAAVAVITFLTALLPRRSFQLNGQLQPAGDEGVGVSLELSQNGGAEALTSFWAKSFDLSSANPETAYQHLAVAAAAWVDIWMTKSLRGRELLTADPLSWAFFRSGVDAQRLGDTIRATNLYEQALAADGSNVGAVANLGIMCRRMGRYEDAEAYLKRALKPIANPEQAPHLHPQENPDWYRIEYQFAALYTSWAIDLEDGPEKTERQEAAATAAKALALATLDALEKLAQGQRLVERPRWWMDWVRRLIKRQRPLREGAPKKYLQSTLKPFLAGTIEPAVLVLLAGTKSADRERPKPSPVEQDRPSRAAIRALIDGDDPDPWALIAYIEKGNSRPAATRYNLACFYTRAGDLTEAARRLITAVRETQRQERGSLVTVALGDPVLAPLFKRCPGLVDKLHEMLDGHEDSDAAQKRREHFERQTLAVKHFDTRGWRIKWSADDTGFDLEASTDSELVLIRVAQPQPSGDDGPTSVQGRLSAYGSKNGKRVSASIVISANHRLTDAQLEFARTQGLQILRATRNGLHDVTADAPALVPA